MSRQFDYSKNQILIYIVEEHLNLLAKLGVTVGFDSSSSINVSDETLGCESLSLSCIYLIQDEMLILHHVVCEEESLHDHVCSIRNRRPRYFHASIEVHEAYLISFIITLQING